jgi:DNA repair exonuclease SbcCD ATPase subunit
VRLLWWLFGAVVVPLVLSEFTDLCPWMAESLVRRAARRLPEQERPRWEADWLAELASKQGRLSKLAWALWSLPLLRGSGEMGRLLGSSSTFDRIRARLRAAGQKLLSRSKAASEEEQKRAMEQAAARTNLFDALEEALGRQQTSERALAKAEADAARAAKLVAARVEAEQALTSLDERLGVTRERHAELSESAGVAANRLEAARQASSAAAELDPDAPCPTCCQPLGAAHDELRRRHDEELAAAGAAHDAAVTARKEAVTTGKALAERRAELAGLLEQARAAETRAAKAVALVEAAGAALELNVADVATRRQALDQATEPGEKE